MDMFMIGQNILLRHHRVEAAYLNTINILSKKNQAQNNVQYRSCINYLQAITYAGVIEGKVLDDFMNGCYSEA